MIFFSHIPNRFKDWGLSLWAVACGGIAAGIWPLSPQEGLRLLLTLLLVGVGWGRFWHFLATTDWATPLRRWRTWSLGESGPVPPYTRPGSPAHRLARWLGQLTSWGKMVFLPAVGPALGTAAVGLITVLILAAALGESMVLLALGGVALAQLALVWNGGKGSVGAGWHALMGVGFPWLAGHLALAPLSLASAILTVAFSLAAFGKSQAPEQSGLAAWIGGYLAAIVLFLINGRPLVVPYLALLMLLPLLVSTSHPMGWKPRAFWLVGGMLLAAVAL
ncbi:MAG: hypothetical protein RMK65_06905 [Anaerolineae bacterium]|nr:hypothetical protein [Anaerolineae bacterium]MDW7991852.1 hypothetical protein [Anaerolineae bacterium]